MNFIHQRDNLLPGNCDFEESAAEVDSEGDEDEVEDADAAIAAIFLWY